MNTMVFASYWLVNRTHLRAYLRQDQDDEGVLPGTTDTLFRPVGGAIFLPLCAFSDALESKFTREKTLY